MVLQRFFPHNGSIEEQAKIVILLVSYFVSLRPFCSGCGNRVRKQRSALPGISLRPSEGPENGLDLKVFLNGNWIYL